PSGFYAAGHLLAQADRPVEVDLYERLPTPFGLVRGGVAPDHPKIKSVTRVYDKVATGEGCRFFGNVEVGRDVTHEELGDWYDAVVYTVGTAADRRSGVPGEDLPGSVSATEFVGWYNGHPDYRDQEFDLSGERAVVVGNGNVAIDVARMLTLRADELALTDIADHALEELAASNVTEVVVLGRRGPEQAAFTNPELLELGELKDADVIVDPEELALPGDLREPEPDRAARRKAEILSEYAARRPSGRRKRIVLRFLASPVEILGTGRVEAVRVARNELVRDEHGVLRARATDRTEVLEAGIVLRAIGYLGAPVAGLPFDTRRGLIPHERGRIVEDAGPVRGAYVAGWIKRGPSGVIGTNKKCAQETVAALMEDLAAGRLDLGRERPSSDEVVRRLVDRGVALVEYAGWQSIDHHEQALGRPAGRPRVKLTRSEELLAAAGNPVAAG
ncbi:MAG: ferredoxin/flavodoxin---NADP+ reductase, partial [Solirubrobacteraceae bacterium]|nr:ferredoxin/flavodoxin---NADP+ reductase [Solirubrobacteraceae bacterium]